MKRLLACLAVAAILPACASYDWRRGESTEMVALVVKTEPPGAQVRVGRLERAWTTPCDVSDPSIRKGPQEVLVALDGYETVSRRVTWDGDTPVRLDLKLVPRQAVITVQNVPPGARVMLFRLPAGTKNPAGIARLWSENEDALKAAIDSLTDEDAARVPARLHDLAGSRSEAVAAAAKPKARDGVDTVQLTHRVTGDGSGTVRLEGGTGSGTLALLVTRAGGEDFAASDLKAPQTVTLPAPPPPPAKVDGPALAKLTVKAAGDRVRVTAAGKVVADVPTPPEESVKLTVPREKVLVEFLDSKTGVVTGSVELVPEAEAAVAPAPRDADRIGLLQLVSLKFGIFVRLDAGQEVTIGEMVAIFRDGREVARAKVLRVCSGDALYPAGAAMLSPEASAGRKGDEARRAKP